MPQASSPIVERIKMVLHAQYDAILNEPLPERWVDLIQRLSEQEHHARSAQTKREARPTHKPGGHGRSR
jgi:hypothetical protein